MFKSKTDFNAFDKNNSKVKNLEAAKTKALTKSGTKKLINKLGEKTSYHLVLDYFVDDKGKTLGHFLDLGENKKLSKHFEQVEMKAGKLDKSMSESPKKACAGFAYIELVKGKKVVHIEPNANSKIPKGKWAKILKDLKPLFGGLKAVVVLAGELIEADPQEEGEDVVANAEEPTKTEKPATDQIKELIVGISGILKEQLPKVVLPNVKSKNVSQEDLDITSDLFDKIEDFKAVYEEATAEIQQKIAKHYNSILNQVPKLEKIQLAVENLLGISDNEVTEEAPDTAEVKALKELLAYVNSEMDSIEKNFTKAKDEITNAASEIIAGGEELLKALF
ncbi:hypothetical protein [Aureispira anguillae]|uniref:Uncharacterized protein n=1 Tax=Aureispira anguillae TaxID=2864201 RepID=A0A916DXH4_9BACT|nr:hypothetical protein [Aureispira anguillae]BDS15086.1 hypothetical protein AsAng_0058700 [Aureispira anguillae]